MDSFKSLIINSFNVYLIATHMPSTVEARGDRVKGVNKTNKDLPGPHGLCTLMRQTLNMKINERDDSECW